MTDYGPKTEWDALQEGVRIYYTGDVANADAYGTITLRRPIDPRWSYRQIDIVFDDGRKFRGVMLSAFQPAPGRRFWLERDWLERRQARLAQLQAQFSRPR